ncbi:MAG: glycosyltransferase family 4 protein [Anaeromyxobacter sp.]
MRVCIVTPYDLSRDGGVNRHAWSLAAALRTLDHEAEVLGPASGPVPEGCIGLPGVVPVPANGSVARVGLLVSARRTRQVLEAGGFDLIHIHEPIVPGPGRFALRQPVPIVATFHANDDRELPLQTVLRRVISASGRLNRIDVGIAVSRAAKRFSRALYRGRTAVIPNGVDLSRFTAGGPVRSPVRLLGPDDPAAPRVLFVGRYGEQRKGFAVLLDAAARLLQRGRAIEVHVVGDGPEERFAARARGLDVVFHGRVTDAELSEHYRTADVFCAPSLGGESFGMVLVEAMAAGCPVVASDLPGYAEAARGAALLAARGDAQALAAALERALSDPGLRQRLSARGLARAGALSWTRVAARVAHVYGVALAEHQVAPPVRGLAARALRAVRG